MTKDTPPSRRSIFSRSDDENDFVFFRTIENTLKGILVFLVAYFYTSRLLFLHPRRMTAHLVGDDRFRLSQPYTYLAIAAFAAYLAVQYHGLQFVFDPAIREVTPDLSVSGLLTTTLPAIALIVFSGWLLGSGVAGSSERRRHIVELVCYSAGFQCVVVVVASLAVAAYWARVGVPSGDLYFGTLFEAIWVGLFWMIVGAYATLVPAAVLWRPIAKEAPRVAQGVRKWLTLVGLWGFSIFTLLLGVAPGNVPRDLDLWAFIGAREPRPEIGCWIADATLDENNWLTIDLVVLNETETTWLIGKAPVEVYFQIREAQKDPSTGWHWLLKSSVAEIVSWSDGDAPVLVLTKSGAKWAVLRLQLPSRASDTMLVNRDHQIRVSRVWFQDLRHKLAMCSSDRIAPLRRSQPKG